MLVDMALSSKVESCVRETAIPTMEQSNGGECVTDNGASVIRRTFPVDRWPGTDCTLYDHVGMISTGMPPTVRTSTDGLVQAHRQCLSTSTECQGTLGRRQQQQQYRDAFSQFPRPSVRSGVEQPSK